MILPIPAALDFSGRAPGEPFEVTAVVSVVDGGLQIDSIDGVPLEAEAEVEEETEMADSDEMNEKALFAALKGEGMS